ncbi:MAG: hypothetical protein Q9P14_02375 [candidate division KSB1 bacterium]|nr:hypothetical protein [candidate division KSB1 bacterium]MDQ7065073.1 hypothetical protein [candidate division KSB1 bacterium]
MASLDPLAPGSLPRPGWIGRLVRLLLGGVFLWGTYRLLLAHLEQPPGTNAPTPLFLMAIVVAFYGWHLLAAQYSQVLPPKRATLVPIVLTGLLLIADGLVYQRLWAPPAAWFLFVMTVSILGFIGFSFLLAALLAAPG